MIRGRSPIDNLWQLGFQEIYVLIVEFFMFYSVMFCFRLLCCVSACVQEIEKLNEIKQKFSATRIETETLMQFSFFSFLNLSLFLFFSLVAGKFCCKSLLQHEQQEEEEEANTQVAAVGADAATAAAACHNCVNAGVKIH